MTAWIQSRYPDYASSVGKCAQACHEMKAEFPELRLTNGEVSVLGWPEPRLHWWLVAPDGSIVDPTAAQFPAVEHYEEITDAHPARNYERMRCPNCGESFYNTPEHGNFTPLCSQDCATAYAAYCMNPF